jgi:cobalt-zinc-cadmium efflux system membrane fusion protein
MMWLLRHTLVLSLSLTAGCASPPAGNDVGAAAPPDASDLTMTVEQIGHGGIRWAPVTSVEMTETTDVPGQLAPDEDRTARLSAPARARVVGVHVRTGDRVTRGQPLVTLQGADAAAARAAFATAVADLRAHQSAARYARVALERAERLFALKAMSTQDVDRARVEQEEAESMLTQAEVEVDRTRATLTQLGVNPETGEIVMRAPFGGVVLSRDVVPGSVVDVGAPLVMVTDPATLWLEISATESVAPALRPGNRVTFTVPDYPDRTFEATIDNAGAALDPTTRTLPVQARVQNTAGTLRPAMFATISLALGSPREGMAVPEGAMQQLDQRSVVFVAHPDERGGARFERREVEVGARAAGVIQILSGLNTGDLVVTDGAFAVKSQFARLRTTAS